MRPVRLVSIVFTWVCAAAYLPGAALGQTPRGKFALPAENKSAQPTVQPQMRPVAPPRFRGPEIFFCETPGTTCRTTQDTFLIADLRDLYVYVVWPGVIGQHEQTVEFHLPDGTLYSSMKTRFTVGAPVRAFAATTSMAAPNVVAPVPPAPHLVADANKVHTGGGIPSLLTVSRGDTTVLAVLPVGGTYISQRNMTGAWIVRVLLDGRIALQSGFTLTPRPDAEKAAKEKEEGR